MRKRNFSILLGLMLAVSSTTAFAIPVALYSPYDPTLNQDAFEMQQTELVLLQPELKTFADENSEAAMDYSTAMDDWSYYASEITQSFAALHVKVVSTDKRYLIFTEGKDQRMIFDSLKPQPDSEDEGGWGAYLYRKGQPPIAVDITFNDMAAAKAYLGIK
ncbi:MAG: hypothetical protein ACRC2A_03105 [Enterobacterales bacterium]|uniref:hypothetical protein n=1 Tax=Serratia sp. (in: enterobacteria) TaxID=616 RepID=UPI003F3755D0